jgi:Na+/H+-translocating membrane pyrophosphatase
MDRYFIPAAKAVAYVIGLVAALIFLFRNVVGPLFGSTSDLGVLGAVGAAMLGLIGFAWAVRAAVRDLRREFQKANKQ